jgi:hypothetical protein
MMTTRLGALPTTEELVKKEVELAQPAPRGKAA